MGEERPVMGGVDVAVDVLRCLLALNQCELDLRQAKSGQCGTLPLCALGTFLSCLPCLIAALPSELILLTFLHHSAVQSSLYCSLSIDNAAA